MGRFKRALITGITGQDGAHLSKHLLSNGFEVFGTFRRGSYHKTWRLDELGITENIKFVDAQLNEPMNLVNILTEIKPDLIFHLAGISYVSDSFIYPASAIEVNTVGTLNLLEAARIACNDAKIFFASSSEIFGTSSADSMLNENSIANPTNPYGVSKLAATQLVKIYRKNHNMACCSGILFNHEGPFRSRQFVTRKITFNLARLKVRGGMAFKLGNLDASRDWGFAENYTLAMLNLLNSDDMVGTDDMVEMVFATGKLNSVREFLSLASEAVGFAPVFEGEGSKEICFDRKTGNKIAEVSKKYFRPHDTKSLRGDPTNIKKLISLEKKNDLPFIVNEMIRADLKRVKEGRIDV